MQIKTTSKGHTVTYSWAGCGLGNKYLIQPQDVCTQISHLARKGFKKIVLSFSYKFIAETRRFNLVKEV